MEEKVFIKNKKGLKLAAVLHYSDKNKKHPAVVLLHGFTGYKEEKHIEVLAKNLTNNGFVAIRFDASGFGESEGSTETEYRVSNYLSDIESIYRYLISLNMVNKKRIGIWGHSMGGMLSIIFASNHPELKAVCSVSVPNNIPSALAIINVLTEWKHRGFLSKINSKDGQRIKINYDFITDAKKYSVLKYIKKLYQPLLIIIGKKDENVDPDDTRKIYYNAGNLKKLVEFEEMDHYYKNHPKLIKKVNDRIILFFKKYL